MGYRSRSEQLTGTTEITLDTQEVAKYTNRFHKFDKDSKGFITTVDVQRVLQNISVQIDENALHEILNEVDLNKNGQVELNEFLQLNKQTRLENMIIDSSGRRINYPSDTDTHRHTH
uniref:EF-hand domain-containing protein n=1 Tax=Hucho hucho TaxID=62062 RepID=A0A4W5KCJ6_9TELE